VALPLLPQFFLILQATNSRSPVPRVISVSRFLGPPITVVILSIAKDLHFQRFPHNNAASAAAQKASGPSRREKGHLNFAVFQPAAWL